MILYTLNSTPSISDINTLFPSGAGAEYIQKIIENLIEYGASESNQIAYVLATAKHETANFVSLYERYNGNPIDYFIGMYGSDTQAGQILGNLLGPYDATNDAYVYRGRGFVHITGRDNYDRIGDIIGQDLINNPDLAADPDIAAEIIARGMINGYFTGKKLEDYISGQNADYLNARKIVNGTDQASLIAGYTGDYDALIESHLKDTHISFTADASAEILPVSLEGGYGDESFMEGLETIH